MEVIEVKMFNGLQLTEETIQQTREFFYNNAIACIEEVKSGKVYVNNHEYYFKWKEQSAKDYIEGRNDNVVSFLQRAYFIQTGDCIALLP